MMNQTIRIPVLNSLIFIRDSGTRNYPEIDGINRTWSTSTCVAVGCLPDCDGETTIVLTEKKQQPSGLVQVFDKILDTFSRKIIVDIVPGTPILETEIRTDRTRVRIWTDGFRDSEIVHIGLG